jgi:hypothetical protein
MDQSAAIETPVLISLAIPTFVRNLALPLYPNLAHTSYISEIVTSNSQNPPVGSVFFICFSFLILLLSQHHFMAPFGQLF